MQLQQIAIEALTPSPHNPRLDFPKESLQQLANSIGLHGVQEPLKARPIGKTFELVFGHRRLKAAKIAGVDTVPVLVEEMTDLQAAEAQLAENIDREDLAPLEVAAGYKRLLTLGQSMDQVCERSGKKRSTIYATMNLLKLAPEVKKAIGEEQLSASGGQLLSKYVPVQLQAKELKHLSDRGQLSYRDMHEYLHREYSHDLKKAPFDMKDEKLCPAAGSCVKCPKRTGSNPDLFSDDKSPDICTDKVCYAEKVFAATKKETDAKGIKLLSPKEAKDVFSDWGDVAHDSPYIKPTERHQNDSKYRSYKELLTPEQLKALTVVGLDHNGNQVELLPRASLTAAVKKAGKAVSFKDAKPAKAAAYKPPAPDIEELIEKATIAAMVAAVEKSGLTPKVLKLITVEAVSQSMNIESRRELKSELFGIEEKEFDKAFPKAKPAQLAGLLFEAVLDRRLQDGDDLDDICVVLNVNALKLEAEVRAANAIAWTKAGTGATGVGVSGVKYTIEGKGSFSLNYTSPTGSKTGVGTGGVQPFKTLELAKAAALKHEAAQKKGGGK